MLTAPTLWEEKGAVEAERDIQNLPDGNPSIGPSPSSSCFNNSLCRWRPFTLLASPSFFPDRRFRGTGGLFTGPSETRARLRNMPRCRGP